MDTGDLVVHTFTRDSSNVHVIAERGQLVMIDAGYEKNAEALAKDMTDRGLDPKLIRAIILTHGHGDHAGGAPYFHETYGIPVLAGGGDREMLAKGRMEKLCPTGFLGKSRHGTDQAMEYSGQAADTWIDTPTPLQDVAGIGGLILPIPGHTRGTLVVLAGDLVFVGDLFRGSVVGAGAEIHLYNCDVPGNIRDINALTEGPAQKSTLYFTGHFGPVSAENVKARFRN